MGTLLRFESSRAYSSRTSCSRGVQVGVVVDGGAGLAIELVFGGVRAEKGNRLLLHAFLVTEHCSQYSRLTNGLPNVESDARFGGLKARRRGWIDAARLVGLIAAVKSIRT
jgi:hypothetical protein